MTLLFGSDHAGFELRQALAKHARALGHDVKEFGASGKESFDYPVASDEVCTRLLGGMGDFGVLICGTGIGVSIRANRYHGIRAANCTSTEMARLARSHNQANVLCLGERILDHGQALAIFDTFMSSAPDLGGRHAKRVDMLDRNLPDEPNVEGSR